MTSPLLADVLEIRLMGVARLYHPAKNWEGPKVEMTDISEAQAHILADLLDIIGEDEKPDDGDSYFTEGRQLAATFKNQLRQELREAIRIWSGVKDE